MCTLENNLEVDSPDTSRREGKYMKYVSFPWSPLQAALCIFTFAFLLKTKS
jgi:hypothetical protein